MKYKIKWLWLWLCEFLKNLWRRNDYFLAGGRASLSWSAFVAKVVADACIRIKKGKDG